MVTGTAQIALVGYVEIWSLIKTLQMRMIHYNVHSVKINVSIPCMFMLHHDNQSYGLNLFVLHVESYHINTIYLCLILFE